jgi:predicted transcriptional regulator
MRLKEYIEDRGIPLKEFARRTGITYSQAWSAIKGRKVSLKTAIAIEKFTEGKVKPEELL